MAQPQSEGRKANAAQPLGDRPGLVSDRKTDQIAGQERRSAGPDGPDARGTSPDRGAGGARPDAFEGRAGDPAKGPRP